jgi:hypothetical protein
MFQLRQLVNCVKAINPKQKHEISQYVIFIQRIVLGENLLDANRNA